jgi:hypothetical protein
VDELAGRPQIPVIQSRSLVGLRRILWLGPMSCRPQSCSTVCRASGECTASPASSSTSVERLAKNKNMTEPRKREQSRRGEAAHHGERKRLIGPQCLFPAPSRSDRANDGCQLVMAMGHETARRAAATTASTLSSPRRNAVRVVDQRIPFDTAIADHHQNAQSRGDREPCPAA